jgi:hypothetical protein
MNTNFEQFDADYREKVRRVNEVLLRFGWAVAPQWMIGEDFEKLDAYCREINLNPPEDPMEAYRTIQLLLAGNAFLPHYRACSIYRATRLPHFKDFSHYLERASFLAYQHDYLSAVIVMLPVIEGVLRSHTGVGEGRIAMGELFKKLSAQTCHATEPIFVNRYPVYKEILLNVFNEWIYKQTDGADFDLSYLNRHYILHGIHSVPFDRADCQRLIHLFDLYMEVVACEVGIMESAFLPDPATNEFVERRMKFYANLIIGNPPLETVIEAEEMLMREHTRYTPAEPLRTLLKTDPSMN